MIFFKFLKGQNKQVDWGSLFFSLSYLNEIEFRF